MMKWICKLFGHKWDDELQSGETLTYSGAPRYQIIRLEKCSRCGDVGRRVSDAC